MFNYLHAEDSVNRNERPGHQPLSPGLTERQQAKRRRGWRISSPSPGHHLPQVAFLPVNCCLNGARFLHQPCPSPLLLVLFMAANLNPQVVSCWQKIAQHIESSRGKIHQFCRTIHSQNGCLCTSILLSLLQIAEAGQVPLSPHSSTCCCQTARHFKVLWAQCLIYALSVCTMPSTTGAWLWQGCPDTAIINYNYDWLPKSRFASWGRLLPTRRGRGGSAWALSQGTAPRAASPAPRSRGRGASSRLTGGRRGCLYARGRKRRLLL